jgi:hypothetical protein
LPIEKGNITATLKHALQRVLKFDEVLLVCGSFFIMQESRVYFGFNDEQDS